MAGDMTRHFAGLDTLSPQKHEVQQRRLLRLFFATYWLIVFTGAIRKWLFPTVVSRVFRTFDLPSYSGRLLGLGCFAAGPRGGQQQSGQAMATISASRSICR